MRNMFEVKGTLGAFGGSERIAIVEESGTNRPFMMNAYGGIMDYLNEVSSSDAEEKYMDCIYCYSAFCLLEAVIVPSTDENIPAKVVILSGKDHSVKVFGTKEIIDTRKPEPMSWDEWRAAMEYTLDNEDYNIRILLYRTIRK